MTIEKTAEIYEVLVRFEGGVFSGAHARRLETIRDEGVILLQRELDPEPVNNEFLSELFNADDAALFEQLSSATDNLASAVAELAEARAQIGELEGAVIGHVGALNQSNAEIAALRSELEACRETASQENAASAP